MLPGKSLSECINNASTQIINNVQEANIDIYYRQLLENLQIKSMVYMPIIIENLDHYLWGLLVVNFCDKLHFWEQNEIRFLNEITLHIAIGIHQGLLVEELQKEIRQRKEAEKLLDETNNNLAKLVAERTAILEREQSRLSESQKIAHIGSFEYDIATDQAIWSEETYHIYQYDPDLPPPSNQEFMSAFHPEDLPKYLAVLAEVSQEPLPFDIEYRFQCADGTLKYINSRGKSVVDHEGKIKSLIGVAINVTEQKKIDLKIQEQAERLKLIIEGTEMATWDWDLTNNQLLWSERHFEILGLPYLGNEQGDFAVFQERIHPEDRQAVLDLYNQRLQDRQMYKKEYRIIRADNQKVVWLGALGSFMADQAGKTSRSMGVLFDITERKEAEIALQQTYNELVQSQQRFSSLIEATSQAVWSTDGNGLVRKGTPSWQKLTGQTDQEIFGTGWLEAIHPDDRERVSRLWQEAQIVPTKFDCEYRLRNTQGIYRYYHSKGIPLFNEQNKLYEWIGVATDITEIKQAQQILEEANTLLEQKVLERTIALEKEIAERMAIEQELQQVTTDLKRSNQELSQFAYITSHDLQEPLRAISNFAQKIMTNYHGQLDNKADMYLEFVIDGANRMQQLIKDILAYSRIGRMESEWRTINLNNLLTKVCHDLQVTIRETQATITIAPLPLVQGNHSQLSLLWQNLISNSLKYHSDRPIHIEIFVPDHDPREISLSDSKTISDSYEILAIRDNGIGIAPEYSDRIFTIFQRLHTSDEYPGTGLGLAICQKIIEQHNGRIWVKSELGAGSTFYLMLLRANMESDLSKEE